MTEHQKEILYKKLYGEKNQRMETGYCICSDMFCMFINFVYISFGFYCKSARKI